MSNSEKPKSSWRERRQSIKHKWLAPFIFPEWLCERVSNLLGRWAFLDILGHAGRLTILIAVIFYFLEADERRMQAENQRKAKHYQAWQVINAAQGKPGSGGRIDALQDLNKDKVILASIDLSNANLSGINLQKARLEDANLSEANLWRANLSGAVFFKANLSGAYLRDANLSEANLWGANLPGADLAEANLPGTDLRDANLSGASLWRAYLSGARLLRANLSGADLGDANLSGASLWHSNLSGANLYRANLSGADLEGANLSGSSMYNANLSRAELNDANLSEADMRFANLDKVKGWQKVKSIEFANIDWVRNAPYGFIEWARERWAVQIRKWDEWQALLKEERGKKK